MDILKGDVARMGQLLDDMRNSVEVNRASVQKSERAISLPKLLKKITQNMKAQLDQREVMIFTDLPACDIIVRGVEDYLVQAIINIIDNAMSFLEMGDAIRVWCRLRDQHVLIAIEDTGPGIDPNALSNAFEGFYSRRPNLASTAHSGLGLAIVRQIINAHGGRVWCENVVPTEVDLMSEPMGARFLISLPYVMRG